MITLYRKNKQQGIGLLELMLALAISAILIIVSVQYFQSTKNSTFVNAAVQEVQTIVSATNGLTAPAKTADCVDSGCKADSNGDGNQNIINAVALSGSLPGQYVKDGTGDGNKDIITPWGPSTTKGQFTIDFDNTSTSSDGSGTSNKSGKAFFQITGKKLPNYGCQSLKSQFSGMAGLVTVDDLTDPDADADTTPAPVNPQCSLDPDGTGTFTMQYYVSSGNSLDPPSF